MTQCTRKAARKTALAVFLLGGLLARSGTAAAAPLTITTGKVEAAAGKEVQVPIMVKGVKDAKGVSCMSMRLKYDPAILTFKALDKGPALPNALFDKSVDEKADPGVVGLGFVCGSKTPSSKEMASVEDDGVVLKVLFVVNEKATVGQKCHLKLDNYRVLDTAEPPLELPVSAEDGEFKVIGSALADLPWLWIALGAGAFLLLLIVLVVTRRKSQEEPRHTVAPASAAPAGGILPRFTPESPTFSHVCVKCGGVIQLPRAMLGQSFECGACGTKQVAKQ